MLAEFSYCDSGTLSTLFRTYCINIMDDKRGDKLINIWINCILHRKRHFAEYGKYHCGTHNNLVHFFSKSYLINTVLKKGVLNLYGP